MVLQQTISKEEYVTIDYIQDKQIVVANWKGYANKTEFKKTIDFLIEFCETNPVRFLITDTREQAVVEKESTDYAANAVPSIIAKGVKHMLFILPESLFTLMSVDMYKEELSNSSAPQNFAQYFTTQEEALEWIDEHS